jgi:hypothetical protein
MAGVQDTKVIDVIGEGPDGEVIMFIVEERRRTLHRVG